MDDLNFLIEPNSNGLATAIDGGPLSPSDVAIEHVDTDADGDTDRFSIFIGTGGDVAARLNFFSRGLDPEFISIFDILASSGDRTEGGLWSVAIPGGLNWSLVPTGDDWLKFADLVVVPQSQDGMQIRLSATRIADGVAVQSPVLDLGGLARIIGTLGSGRFLYRLQGTPGDFGLPAAAPLRPLGIPSHASEGVVLLTPEQLAPIVDEAIARWAATGIPAEQIELLEGVALTVSDLDAVNYLGLAAKERVWLDDDAGGVGWYLDPVPGDDVEFAGLTGAQRQARPGTLAENRMDLLTVVLHELGHVLGFDDLDATIAPHTLMTEALGAGTRRLPIG
jgi:hypothetical protein